MGRQMIWDSFELDVWEEETGLSFFSSPFSLLPAVHQLPGIKKKVASYICWKYEKHGHKLHTQSFFYLLFQWESSELDRKSFKSFHQQSVCQWLTMGFLQPSGKPQM